MCFHCFVLFKIGSYTTPHEKEISGMYVRKSDNKQFSIEIDKSLTEKEIYIFLREFATVSKDGTFFI